MFWLPTCNSSWWNSSSHVLWKLLHGIGVYVPFVFQTTPQSRNHTGLNRNSMLTTNTGSLFCPLALHLCLHRNMFYVALLKKLVQPAFCSYLRENLIWHLCRTYFMKKTGLMIHLAFILEISYSTFSQTTDLHNIWIEIHVLPVYALFYHISLNKCNHSEMRHLTDQKSMWLCAYHWLFILPNSSQWLITSLFVESMLHSQAGNKIPIYPFTSSKTIGFSQKK
jgi:hypothetical protein